MTRLSNRCTCAAHLLLHVDYQMQLHATLMRISCHRHLQCGVYRRVLVEISWGDGSAKEERGKKTIRC
jgi:hypothetical protein